MKNRRTEQAINVWKQWRVSVQKLKFVSTIANTANRPVLFFGVFNYMYAVIKTLEILCEIGLIMTFMTSPWGWCQWLAWFQSDSWHFLLTGTTFFFLTHCPTTTTKQSYESFVQAAASFASRKLAKQSIVCDKQGWQSGVINTIVLRLNLDFWSVDISMLKMFIWYVSLFSALFDVCKKN